MQNDETVEPAPDGLKGASRVWIAFALLAASLFMTVPIYGGWLSGEIERAYRFGLPILWGALAVAAARSERLKPISTLLLCLFGVSLGFALAYIIGSRQDDWFGLSWDTPKGAAVDKIFFEVLPVCAAIFLAAFLAHLNLETLGVRGGRVLRSLGLGLLASVPLFVLFAVDPSGSREAVLATPAAVIRSWLPWIIAFSIANGFMEELWFRGLWLGGFGRVIGAAAAMHVTSLSFWLMHMIVYWGDATAIAMLTPVWLYMGYTYAVIRRMTGSLWGPVLAHSVADVIFMLITFSTGRI